MVVVPMIAVLDRCWLRATMIEARSRGEVAGEKSRAKKAAAAGFGVGFAGAMARFVWPGVAVRASRPQAAFQITPQEKARSECQKDAGRSWTVRSEEVVTGPVVWVDGGWAVVVVLSGFSLAGQVRWGIRSYSSVGGLVYVRASLKFLATLALDLIRLPSNQCGLWPRQHHSGLAWAVGRPSRLYFGRAARALFAWYSPNRYMTYAPIGLTGTNVPVLRIQPQGNITTNL